MSQMPQRIPRHAIIGYVIQYNQRLDGPSQLLRCARAQDQSVEPATQLDEDNRNHGANHWDRVTLSAGSGTVVSSFVQVQIANLVYASPVITYPALIWIRHEGSSGSLR